MIHSIFGYPEAMNVGFRILKTSKKIEQNIRDTQVYGLFRSTFVAHE